jgi:acetyltransferase-like isoleucine patch superfamily enzyme
VGKGVFIDADVEIGNAVKIQNNVSVFHGVVINDGVFVGPHVCFTNDLYPRAVNCDMSPKSATDWAVSPTIIHRGASLGANATIVCGIEVGEWALVAAGSVVTKSVPPFALVRGNPARIVGVVGRSGTILSKDYSAGVFYDPEAAPTTEQSVELSRVEILPEWCG